MKVSPIYRESDNSLLTIMKYTPLLPFIFIFDIVRNGELTGDYKKPIGFAVMCTMAIALLPILSPTEEPERDINLHLMAYMMEDDENSPFAKNASNEPNNGAFNHEDSEDIEDDREFSDDAKTIRSQYFSLVNKMSKKANIPSWVYIGINALESGFNQEAEIPNVDLKPTELNKRGRDGKLITLKNADSEDKGAGIKFNDVKDGTGAGNSVGCFQILKTYWDRNGKDGNDDGKVDPLNFPDNLATATAHIMGSWNDIGPEKNKVHDRDAKFMMLAAAYNSGGGGLFAHHFGSGEEVEKLAKAIKADKQAQKEIYEGYKKGGTGGVNAPMEKFLKKNGYTIVPGGQWYLTRYKHSSNNRTNGVQATVMRHFLGSYCIGKSIR